MFRVRNLPIGNNKMIKTTKLMNNHRFKMIEIYLTDSKFKGVIKISIEESVYKHLRIISMMIVVHCLGNVVQSRQS